MSRNLGQIIAVRENTWMIRFIRKIGFWRS
jgi:hypothetical protein